MEEEKDKVQEYLDGIKPKSQRVPYIWPTWIIVISIVMDLVKYYVIHYPVSDIVAILSIILIVALGIVCGLLVKYYRLFRYTYIILVVYVSLLIFIICKYNFSFLF